MPDNYSDGAQIISRKISALAAAVLSALVLAGCAGKNETAYLDEAVDNEYYIENESETAFTEYSLGYSETQSESATAQPESVTEPEQTKPETEESMDSQTVSAEKAAGSQTEEAVTAISAETAVPSAVSEETEAAAKKESVTEIVTETEAPVTVSAAPESEIVTDCSVPMAESPTAPTDYDSSFFTEDLFIGDSISTGYSLYGFLAERNVFAKVGLNPSTVLTKTVSTCFGDITISDMIAYTMPERVYIMLGSNGIQWLSVDNMLMSTDTLVTLINIACPDAEVMIVSVPPVTPEYAATVTDVDVMAKINEYNDSLSDYCAENDMLFIDAASVLKNSSGYFDYSYAESDGMHFKASAYKVLLSKIQSDVTAFEESRAEETEAEETQEMTSETVSEETVTSVSEDKVQTDTMTVTAVPDEAQEKITSAVSSESTSVTSESNKKTDGEAANTKANKKK